MSYIYNIIIFREDGWTVDTNNNDVTIDWRPGEAFDTKIMENGGNNIFDS